MKAVILAGGRGVRLMPLTKGVPKVMLPIKGKPLLEHVLEHVKRHGINEAIITTGYKGDVVSGHFLDGSRLKMKLMYSHEREPLGTAGCLNPVKDRLTETFLLYGGDNLTDLDLGKLIKFHKREGGIMTVAVFEFSEKIPWGVYTLNRDQSVDSFQEKPTFRHNAGTMIMCIEPEIFRYIPEGFSNITDHIIPELLKRKKKVYGYPFSGKWMDVGSVQDYEREK